MAWQEPKTDWQANPKNPMAEDFNRIEGNVDFLKTDIETKKGAIVDALNTVGLASELTDTHATLASRITGANQGTKIITPGTTNQTIAKGFHSGSGYVKGDANLVAGNIVSGKSIFGVAGSVNVGKKWGSGTVAATKPAEGGCLLSVRSLVFRPSFIWVEFAENRIVRWADPGLSPGFNTAWNTMYLYMWRYSGSDAADAKTDISITLYSNGFDIHFTGFTLTGAIAKWIAFE